MIGSAILSIRFGFGVLYQKNRCPMIFAQKSDPLPEACRNR